MFYVNLIAIKTFEEDFDSESLKNVKKTTPNWTFNVAFLVMSCCM